MATCGNCKTTGMTVEHIRSCYAQKNIANTVVMEKPVVQAQDFHAMALTIPESKYALVRETGLVFFELREGRKGKWTGYQFMDRLTGAPGDWKRTPIKGQAKKDMLAEIAQNPKEAAVRYSMEFQVCAACGSPLSDPESRERGLGPVCAAKF